VARPMVRAASDGVSALIGSNGQVLAQAAEFKPTVLGGSVQPRTGLTGYVRVGNWLVVVLGLLGAVGAIVRRFGKF
jgi:apolipoprotein N-acyltransferase